MRRSGVGRRATGSIVGVVTAEKAGFDVSGSAVFIYSPTTKAALAPQGLVVDSSGSFQVDSVPAGPWFAYCVPRLGLPFAPVSYKGVRGFSPEHATPIQVSAGSQIEVDFLLPPAGQIGITVKSSRGKPIGGVFAVPFWTIENVGGFDVAANPVETDTKGFAILTNVPLRSKIALIAPSGYSSMWYPGPDSLSFEAAKVVTIPAAGQAVSLRATMR